MAKKAKASATGSSLLDLPVTYGKVSVGDSTCSVGIKVHRANLNLRDADKILVGRRLTARLCSYDPGQHPDQGSIPGMEAENELEGVFDVRGIGVTGKTISCTLNFSLKGIDVGTFTKFANRGGKVSIEHSEELSEDDAKGDDDE